MGKILQVENGCYVDGHWGRFGIGHMADQMAGMGVPVSDEELTLAHSAEDEDDECFEQRYDLAQELEDRLNSMLPDGQLAHWHDGEFFVSPWCGGEEGECGNDECACNCW